MLANKVEITIHPIKLAKTRKTHVSFYMKYASIVSKTLKKPIYQKFLKWMLHKENIQEHKITNIQIMVFPSQKKNGKNLAGRWRPQGEILIFPKKLRLCRKLIHKLGKEKVHLYIKHRARAALIHELLHIKYTANEEKVRKLTRKYFTIFTKHQNPQNPHIHTTIDMLFRQQKPT